MAIVARQVLFLVVISMLISSQASAQVPLLEKSNFESEDPPGTFSDEAPPLGGAPLLDGELGDEIPPGMEPKPLDIEPEELEEEIVFDGSYWDVISSGEWLNSGLWYTQADLVMLNRSAVQRRELTALAFVSGSIVQNLALSMTTEAATFGFEPGMRLTLGKFLGRDKKNQDQSIEFSYLGMNEWLTGHAVANVTANLFYVSLIDGDAAGFKFADLHGFSYKSNFNSYEINARVRSRLGKDRMVLKANGHWQRESNKGRMTSYFGGLRLISIDEEFSYFARGRTVFQGATPDAHSGDLLVKANNDMFGFQLGAEFYEQTYHWSYGLRGKVGALVNFADQRSTYQFVDTVTSGTPFNVAANDEQLTLLLELSIAATYQLRPNVALRFSYDLLYLQGLALAPEQLSFNSQDQARINTGSFTLFDGASFGFEVIW